MISILGDDLLEFHQAVVSTLRDADDIPLDPAPLAPDYHLPPFPDEVAKMKHETQITELNQVDHNEDESDNG